MKTKRQDGWIKNSDFAAQLGVTPRCLWNWERRGIIEPGKRINGKIFRRAGSQPRFDPESKTF